MWRRSRALAIDVYQQTRAPEFRAEWGFRQQMRGAALSIPPNIAERASRGSNRECSRFLWFARGSLAELATQADIAKAIGLLNGACGTPGNGNATK